MSVSVGSLEIAIWPALMARSRPCPVVGGIGGGHRKRDARARGPRSPRLRAPPSPATLPGNASATSPLGSSMHSSRSSGLGALLGIVGRHAEPSHALPQRDAPDPEDPRGFRAVAAALAQRFFDLL